MNIILSDVVYVNIIDCPYERVETHGNHLYSALLHIIKINHTIQLLPSRLNNISFGRYYYDIHCHLMVTRQTFVRTTDTVHT